LKKEFLLLQEKGKGPTDGWEQAAAAALSGQWGSGSFKGVTSEVAQLGFGCES